MNDDFLFFHKAALIEVLDGDTVRLAVDLRFGLTYTDTFRLWGINTPEMEGASKEAGAAARDHLQWLIETFGLAYLQTVKTATGKGKKARAKREKYGRYLAILHAGDPVPVGDTINKRMIDDGFATPYLI